MAGSKIRGFKVAEKIQSIVATQLNRVSEPRFSLVTISRVDVTPDLRSAKIFWITHGDDKKIESVKEAFDDHRTSLRKVIASQLGTRLAPEIKFIYDDSFEVADRMEAIFAKIRG